MTLRGQLRPALATFLLLSLLTGLVYPLVVTGVAQVAMPGRANGSLVKGVDGGYIGSSLIGQNFTDPKYFWGRPSATAGAPYTAYDGKALTGSSGSNLGPLSADLRTAVEDRIAALRAADPGNTAEIPADLVTASASGLDPTSAWLPRSTRLAAWAGRAASKRRSCAGSSTSTQRAGGWASSASHV